VIRAFLRAKGIRQTIAVSDAVAFAGMPPGSYVAFGTHLELREDGRLFLAGTPYLAGSTSTLEVAVGVAMRDGGLSLADAVSLVTANPAALIESRLESRAGSIAVGAPADIVGFRVDLRESRVVVERTVVDGRDVYRRERSSADGAVR
jgi:N-acetylglucosamine-6-phosphate deacetylase